MNSFAIKLAEYGEWSMVKTNAVCFVQHLLINFLKPTSQENLNGRIHV